ncbi:MAG: EAL domain-containing protein [Granulosicoccus sp.]
MIRSILARLPGRRYGVLLHSRPLRMSMSIVLLMLSVLFLAEFLGLRGDHRVELRDARALVTQSLAVQLSTLASSNSASTVEQAVAVFVENNDDVTAAALVEADGSILAAYGNRSLLRQVVAESTLTHVSVPIFDDDENWGDVRVIFKSARIWRADLAWFGFVTLSAFAAFWMFFAKALIQLDPGRAVPGRVDSAFNLFSEGVVILDDKLRIVMANSSAALLIGVPSDQLLGQTLDDWPWLEDDDWQAPWETTLHSGLGISDKPVRLRVNADESRLFMISCSLVGGAEESQHGVLVTLDDVTVLEKKNHELANVVRELRLTQDDINAKNRELEVLATRDPLTGLFNRRVLMENLEREFLKASRENTRLSCIMVDIDHFKQVNDAYGHSVGDEVIQAVAGTLNYVCREYDTVGRYGGEEFLMLMPGLSAVEALDVAERIRNAVMEIATLQNVRVSELSASLGVADLSRHASSGPEMVDQADQALYAAKQSGRNRAVVYDPKVVSISATEPAPEIRTSLAASDQMRVYELEALVRQRNSDLSKIRQYDGLTGVPMRALFVQRVDTEIQRASRIQTGIGIMSFELRELSRLLSTFGHAAVDELVIDFVSRLHEGLRSTDLISDITSEHSLSRITNNEFCVMLSDLGEAENAMPVITRLRRLLSEPFQIGDERVYIGANIGIAIYPQSGETAESLLESAGRVRYEAALRPDKVSHSFASEQLDEASRSYIRLEADLHVALKKNELELYFQPKFDLSKRRVTGLEALLRWRHTELGFISPVDFIPVAEANGLIDEIFDFVLASALKQVRLWYALGFDDLCVSINISPVQLRDPLLAGQIVDAVAEAGVGRGSVEIELTETAVIESRECAVSALDRLRDAGIGVSMDDFGTGYTSLALLADLPLDTVKIDRSFVVAMGDSDRSRAIVESIINMAHALDLRVVGEGIETNEQLATLTALGCDEIQGYLISRPLPIDQTTAFLENQREQLLRRRA